MREVSIETCQTKVGKTHYFVWVKSGRQLVATKALVRAELQRCKNAA